jgi:hypothetical protein
LSLSYVPPLWFVERQKEAAQATSEAFSCQTGGGRGIFLMEGFQNFCSFHIELLIQNIVAFL